MKSSGNPQGMKGIMNLRERNQMVEELRDRMQEELTAWVKKEEVLRDGEAIVFTLQIVPRASSAPKVKHVKAGAQTCCSQKRQLTEEDWEKIFSVNWFDHQEKALQKLKSQGNKSISYRQFFGEGNLVGLHSADSFSSKFRTAGLPYRLRADYTKGGHMIQELHYHICVMSILPKPS